MANTDLHSMSPSLWYKVNVLIYDLHHLDLNTSSGKRLEKVAAEYYLGAPYFTDEEVTLLRNMNVAAPMAKKGYTKADRASASTSTTTKSENQKTVAQEIEDVLQERLEKRIKKRVESGDFRVCAAHDLAPVLGRVFGVEGKSLARNKKFLEVLEKRGLTLVEGDEWEDQGGKGAKGVVKGGKKGRKG